MGPAYDMCAAHLFYGGSLMPRVFHPCQLTTMAFVRMQNGTNLCENTFAFHWGGLAPPTSGQLNTFVNNLAGTVGNAMRACMSDGWIFTEIYARNIDREVAEEATFQWPSGTRGLRSGAQVAANEACGIVKRTGFTGRGSHGRNSISGFAESDVDGNTVGSTLMALLAQLAIEILVSYLGGYLGPAVAHIPRDPAAPPGNSTPITTAIILDSNVDSQKTRLNSHGR